MQARISQTIVNPSQSGAGTKKWIINFIPDHKTIDKTMGWSASNDTMPQVKISFDNKEDAEDFARSNGWDIEVIPHISSRKIVKKSYADNFID